MVKIKWRQKVIAATGLQVAMVLLASLFSLVTVAADAIAVGALPAGVNYGLKTAPDVTTCAAPMI